MMWEEAVSRIWLNNQGNMLCEPTGNHSAAALAVLGAHVECGQGRESLRQLLGSSQLLQSCLGLGSQLAMRGLRGLHGSLTQTGPHVCLARPTMQADTAPLPKSLNRNEQEQCAWCAVKQNCTLSFCCLCCSQRPGQPKRFENSDCCCCCCNSQQQECRNQLCSVQV